MKLDNLHNRLKVEPGAKNEIFYYTFTINKIDLRKGFEKMIIEKESFDLILFGYKFFYGIQHIL